MIVKGVQSSSDLRFGMVVQGRVIGAIVMRELHTRFGRDNIGYLWMFVEPMLLAIAISGVHLAVHARLPYGMDVVPFYLAGYTPFLMFRQVVNRAPATIESNRTLLFHRQITLFDLLFARALLDLIATSLALFFLIGVTTLVGLGNLPDRPLLMFEGLLLMFWLSLGFGMPIAALAEVSSVVDKLVHPSTYIMMPLSGIFFLAEQIPPHYREILVWGPLVHITQLIRMGQYGNFDSQYADVSYVVIWCVVLTILGMLMLRWVRGKMSLE
jgi:capsular polysaccharide transport system permease protein